MKTHLYSSLVEKWVGWLFSTRNALTIFCIALFIVYALTPLLLWATTPVDDTFAQLALLTLCSIGAMLIGSQIPLFDSRFRQNETRLYIPSIFFHLPIWSIFIIFVIVTLTTAPSIPIIDAILGTPPDELSQRRGDFLKTRTGPEAALIYISTIFSSALIPYSIVLLFLNNSRYRYASLLFFLAFSVSFLQKVLFLNAILPLITYFALAHKISKKMVFTTAFAATGLVILLTLATTSNSNDYSSQTSLPIYFTSTYLPTSSLDYLIWRAVAVPTFTATDTLTVFNSLFNETYLLGSTSSLLSTIFGLERVNLERHVFEHQFGSWNEVANANAVFITDAYANFGATGIIIYSLIAGQAFRWFRLSKDIAFKSLWPVFAFILFSASLIGAIFSNGFLLVFFIGIFLKIGRNRLYS